MQSILRSTRLPAKAFRPSLFLARTPRRAAHSSYGNSQSGHQKDEDAKNPKEHLEHPGPESPADKGTAQSSSQAQSSGSQSASGSSDGSKPAIHQPGPPPENKDADVKAHNKDMENRSKEGDEQVDKGFWSGDVGPKDKKE